MPSQEICRDDWLAKHAKVEDILFPLLWWHQREWVSQPFEPIVNNELKLEYTLTLVHGDLGVYHVLYNAAHKRITGILDFGVAGVGDPAIDLSVLLSGYGETLVREMEAF
jgi:aminoglycoside 2''-phosphotransferase